MIVLSILVVVLVGLALVQFAVLLAVAGLTARLDKRLVAMQEAATHASEANTRFCAVLDAARGIFVDHAAQQAKFASDIGHLVATLDQVIASKQLQPAAPGKSVH